MSRTKYNILLLFLLGLVILATLGKQSWQDNRQTVSAGLSDRVVVVQEPAVQTLDPAAATDTGSARVIANIFEGLVRFKPGTAKIEPCLATSWSVSEDGKAWTFHLRKGVRFHDGTDFDAAAVKFSVERQFKKGAPDAKTYAGFVFAPLEQVEAMDRYTVRFRLKYPYAPFLSNLAMPMAAPVVSPGAVRQYGEKFSAHPVGTGPFLWAGRENQGIILKAYQHYWGTRPAVGELMLLNEPSGAGRVQMLLDQRADIALDLTFEQTSQLRFQGYPVFRATGLDIGYLGFYTDRQPFNRLPLRQAVVKALNREDIFKNLWVQEVRPALGPLPPPAAGYDKNIAQNDYSPGEAARLLKSAGYDNNFSFVIITYTDPRPYAPGGGKMLAEAVARSLSGQDIAVQVRDYPWEQFKQALYRREGDAFLYGWISDNGDPDNFLYTLLSENQINSGLNITRYTNSELETLLVSARTTADQEMRQELYARAQEIINRDAPWVVLNHSLHYAATSNNVRGFVLSPTNWPYLGKLTPAP